MDGWHFNIIKKSHISVELMNINEEQTAVDHLALAEKRNHLATKLIAAPPVFSLTSTTTSRPTLHAEKVIIYAVVRRPL